MKGSKGSVYLIDGSAVFYRAYFAFIRNPLINSKGEDTSATYGFVNSILKLIRDEDPDYLAIVFDTAEPTFRHRMYDDYKSTRAKMPDELAEQIPRIRQAVEALNIPSFELAGYEADDLIGTFAHKAAKAGHDVWCVTGDKDYFQLVDERIRIYYPRKASEPPDRLGREEVKAKFGVYPEMVIDKLALMGDSSDNVPGVPGIGPKTADKLLEQFGSLDAALKGHAEIKAKGVREKIAAGTESALLSRKLVTIDTDVPVEFELSRIKRAPVNHDAARELFLEMEFTGLLKQIMPNGMAEETPDAPGPKVSIDYQTIKSVSELEALVEDLSGQKEVAVDTETTSLNALEAELVGVSLCARAGTAYYVPLGHTADAEHNLPFDEGLAILKKLLENPKVQKFGQNLKYDIEVLNRYDVSVDPVSFDSMLASYLLNPSGREHSLNFLALKHCDHNMQPISELIGSGKKQTTFDTVPVDQAAYYAAEDADYTYRLRGILAPELDGLQMHHLYYNLEVPLINVLVAIEEAGIRVDADFLSGLSIDMEQKLETVRSEIYKDAGGEFNINSTQQLSHILFDKLGLPTKGKTAKKTGYSTDQRVLEELALLHEFPKLVLDFRQITKLKSTYVDAIPKLISPTTGRVHTSFNQAVTATGRLSSTDPNLQNIPVRTEEGRQIRKAFIPRDGDHVLLVADYSQVELRILAHYTNDQGLIAAFEAAEDIHARTAAEVYGVDIDNVTSEQRRAAKTANFAVIYGVSAFGLAQQTELDLSGAKEFIDTYFERYPGIQKYMETTKQSARDSGYVTTLLNRRRYLPEINSKNFNVRQFAERTAINTPIQGTAADMIKTAMLNIHRKMSGMRSRMVLQVHDELVFDAHKDELDDLKSLVQIGMEKAIKLSVPVVVDMGVGETWLDAK
ncbi:MAG: DNA polymerase I [candidate division Zixibacteria bacterium]|nr:DNA polymerase I [candidate division Zixibacteria bacterium]MDH3935821.1 DNA polymerase I [candidate division Zixibacteria bacterium]MDH4032845.1 DNA polymerase I [candidate division Zixibacteria bacterium]